MAARVFHFIRSAALTSKQIPKFIAAECGIEIDTKHNNWSESVDGVSCKRCIAKIEKLGLAGFTPTPTKEAKVKKPKRDKRALRALKKVRKQATKYLERVSKAGSGSHPAFNAEQSIRVTHAEELLGIIEAMLTREREGWHAE